MDGQIHAKSNDIDSIELNRKREWPQRRIEAPLQSC